MKKKDIIIIIIGCLIGSPIGYFVIGPMLFGEKEPEYPDPCHRIHDTETKKECIRHGEHDSIQFINVRVWTNPNYDRELKEMKRKLNK
jgi:hypothetical protein